MGDRRPDAPGMMSQDDAAPRPGEFDLIRTYFAPLATDPGSLGLSDDATVYHPEPGCELVLTKDMLAANVHFFAEDPPEAIAAKALRVNLSDLAAKGATPRAYLLGLGLADDWSQAWLERFACGLAGDQAAFDVTLVGGDTIRSGNGLQVSVTAVGEVPEGAAIRRSGGQPGDRLYVSGTLGDAAAGLKERLDPQGFAALGLSEEQMRHIQRRYLLPQPRVGLAGALRQHASAALDISDGVFADAGHLAKASGVDLEIDLSRLPLSDALRALQTCDPELFLTCLGGGDDYEILCLVPEAEAAGFEAAARAASVPVALVGAAKPGAGAVTVTRDGVLLDAASLAGFRHF